MNQIREYAINILNSCNCALDTYMDGTSYGGYENALKDLQYTVTEQNAMYEYPLEELASALVEIGNEYQPPTLYEYPDFYDWGHFGICDDASCLYDDGAELERAIASGKPFDSGWHGFKKELESMCIVRNNDLTYTVSVSCYMDSAFEDAGLIYDCLSDAQAKLLSDEHIDQIRELLSDCLDFSEEALESKILPSDSKLEELLQTASELAEHCNDFLHESFLICRSAVAYVLGIPEIELPPLR